MREQISAAVYANFRWYASLIEMLCIAGAEADAGSVDAITRALQATVDRLGSFQPKPMDLTCPAGMRRCPGGVCVANDQPCKAPLGPEI
jgi:hypothetical protein